MLNDAENDLMLGDEEEEEDVIGDEDDGRTPLDRTIDKIGMGPYQWVLLSLCGFGWLADNMWLQGVAIILPRVQRHYDIADNYIGVLSAAMFAGMMIGAVGWGTCSDLMGRSTAFNATLFFTAVFGILTYFVDSFPGLCFVLFLLGSSVGGSMPTDGTLLLEHMPNGKQHLVTALSVFFSAGSVLSAFAALLIVPRHSCPPNKDDPCDVNTENQGWRYLLLSLAILTFLLFVARMVFFRLYESPRYLVHAGRPQEAIESLQLISKFNGDEVTLNLGDVQDDATRGASAQLGKVAAESSEVRHSFHEETVFDAGLAHHERGSSSTPLSPSRNSTPESRQDYHSTGLSGTGLEGHHLYTPAVELPNPIPAPTGHVQISSSASGPTSTSHGPSHTRTATFSAFKRPRPLSRASTRPVSYILEKKGPFKRLPRSIRKPLLAWADRVMLVLTPPWLRTTVIVWVVWCSLSLAFTMFNVFFPKLLELSQEGKGEVAVKTEASSLESNIVDVVIYALGGCPGALIGAWMVNSSLGRRWSLAGSTFVTALFCAVFIMADSTWAVRASAAGINLTSTTMWAVLYGWTPEIFGTEVRGTACGIASALSRVGGMIAPMLGGILLGDRKSVV